MSSVLHLITTLLAACAIGSGADPLGTSGALPLGAAVSSPLSANRAEVPLDSSATVLPALLDKTQAPVAYPPLEKLEVGARASTMRVPTHLHTDFSNQALPAAAGLTAAADFQDPSLARSSLIRREAIPSAESRSKVFDEIEQRRQRYMVHEGGTEDDSESTQHHFTQESPEFTPEAIFANKHLAPDVAEFLGHLAQRTRVHRKQVARSTREAGLAQGSVRKVVAGEEDDNDDIEDMKKAQKKAKKTTTLAHFFDRMDAKSTAASWMATDCAALSKNLTVQYEQLIGRSRATWGTAGPASAAKRSEIHTGMFFKHWNIGKHQMKDAVRKFRLAVLSFLATQDAARVKLHIWTDLEKNDQTLKDVLGPIAHHPEFMDAINITTFDMKREFASVPPTLVRDTLEERYNKDTEPTLRPDLYRSVILYNYGGLWMDADTVLMQDVAPLLGEDWAYLVRGKEGAVEGALLSASHPKSHFANDYLISLVMRDQSMEEIVGKQKPILEEIFNNDPAHTTMHVLPPCFMDSETAAPSDMAVLSSGTSAGSDFFGKAVAKSYRAFFSSGIRDAIADTSAAEVSVLQDPSFAKPASAMEEEEEDKYGDEAPTPPSWAFHWRGNFAAAWARGSLADVAERTFMKKLQLHHPKEAPTTQRK